MVEWNRVNKGSPCPVCGKPDWCLLSAHGTAAICQRVESDNRRGKAGWLHFLGDERPTRQSSMLVHDAIDRKDFSSLTERYHRDMTNRWSALSAALDVSIESLKRLRTGYDGQAYTFPMCDGDGRCIGIRRRFPDGQQYCVKGSGNGLFVPDGLEGTGDLLIVEGNSDAAKGLDLGFDTIGRPNCNSCISMTVKYIRNHPCRRLVIVPDNDDKSDGTNPGLDGGQRLARRLRLYHKDIRLVIPPAGKDLREWRINHGELASRIEAAQPQDMEMVI